MIAMTWASFRGPCHSQLSLSCQLPSNLSGHWKSCQGGFCCKTNSSFKGRALHKVRKLRRAQAQRRIQAKAASSVLLHWSPRGRIEVACLLHQQMQAAISQCTGVIQRILWLQSPQATPLQGLPSGHILSGRHHLLSIWTALKHVLRLLVQPLGGHPVGVIKGVPGWQMKPMRGHRRWLGLRPGKVQPVPDAGPWWTPSGILHLAQSIPTGVWLLAALLVAHVVIKTMRERRKERDSVIEKRTLAIAAKSTDLRVQKNRMLRALGNTVEADVPGVEVAPAAEHQWQDPSEWDEATRQQWDDFMRKSRALKLRRDQWWQISSGDDTPYHKLAHDRLTKEGKLPDYNA